MKIKHICIFHKWKTYTDHLPIVYKQCKKCNRIKIVSITPMGHRPYDLKVHIGK
ncbi:hypothetical protein PBI_SCTP2_338 [Salicola phage SCTP-2]|nr:hypothetical protein PBI_SCTP2_338 [Salicola phage SCTP-2]